MITVLLFCLLNAVLVGVIIAQHLRLRHYARSFCPDCGAVLGRLRQCRRCSER